MDVQRQCNWVSEGLGGTAGNKHTFLYAAALATRGCIVHKLDLHGTLFGPLYSSLCFEFRTGYMGQRLAPDDIGGNGETSLHVTSPKEGENSIQTTSRAPVCVL